MKTIAIALGTALAAIAGTASAQVYYNRPYVVDPYAASSQRECWNPRAGRYEEVRAGEYQNDLDFRRCRIVGDVYVERVERQVITEGQECWNWRARRYETVRPGEYQDDLDFGRCRIAGYTYRYR